MDWLAIFHPKLGYWRTWACCFFTVMHWLAVFHPKLGNRRAWGVWVLTIMHWLAVFHPKLGNWRAWGVWILTIMHWLAVFHPPFVLVEHRLSLIVGKSPHARAVMITLVTNVDDIPCQWSDKSNVHHVIVSVSINEWNQNHNMKWNETKYVKGGARRRKRRGLLFKYILHIYSSIYP